MTQLAPHSPRRARRSAAQDRQDPAYQAETYSTGASAHLQHHAEPGHAEQPYGEQSYAEQPYAEPGYGQPPYGTPHGEPGGHPQSYLPPHHPPHHARQAHAPHHEAIVHAHDDRRGRHATARGQGFGWLMGWTVIGTVVPGAGLLAAGRRAAGALVISAILVATAGIAAIALVSDPKAMVIDAAVDPRKLLYLVIGVGVTGLLWALVVLVTHVSLRRTAVLTGPQQVLGTGVAVALVAAVVLPSYEVAHYGLIQRNLISSVFSDERTNLDAARPDAQQNADPWANTPRVNVLLVGGDSGKGRTGTRADTLILASINTKTGDTVLFSLPRNLENVPFKQGTPMARAWPNGFDCGDACLINAIWTWAEEHRSLFPQRIKNVGLAATISGVEGALGLDVDYYAMLNLKGFQDFVDAMGGITLTVDERLPIGGNSLDHGATVGWIEPGKQHMNGYKALWYARSRWSTDDYDRMRRQRCVIGAVTKQADPLSLVKAYPKLARSAKRNIATDIPRDDLQAWADLSLRVQKGGSVRSLPFTNKVIASASPDFILMHRLVRQSLRPPEAAATPSATPSVDASATPLTKKQRKKLKQAALNGDPTKAQSLAQVC